MHFNLDPAPTKVIAIGIIQFLIVTLAPILTVMQSQGRYPTVMEITTILLTALIWLLSYLSLWIHTGTQPPLEQSQS